MAQISYSPSGSPCLSPQTDHIEQAWSLNIYVYLYVLRIVRYPNNFHSYVLRPWLSVEGTSILCDAMRASFQLARDHGKWWKDQVVDSSGVTPFNACCHNRHFVDATRMAEIKYCEALIKGTGRIEWRWQHSTEPAFKCIPNSTGK